MTQHHLICVYIFSASANLLLFYKPFKFCIYTCKPNCDTKPRCILVSINYHVSCVSIWENINYLCIIKGMTNNVCCFEPSIILVVCNIRGPKIGQLIYIQRLDQARVYLWKGQIILTSDLIILFFFPKRKNSLNLTGIQKKKKKII